MSHGGCDRSRRTLRSMSFPVPLRRLPIALAGVVLALTPAVAAARRSDEGPEAHASATHQVVIRDFAFHPGTVHISRGASVRWVWRDGGTAHNVTFAHFRARTRASGHFMHRFTRRGTFRYRCTIHAGMT